MNDVEQMAFLNNIMDYKEFGGSSIKNTEGIRALDEAKNLTNESSDLKTSIDELLNKAKSMKDEAELNVNKAYKDLDDFFETGGDPFKKKDDKFLGGSMSEEGQIRTGIRIFLQKELKNGRIKLDKKDKARVMEYFPTIADDPILVFKKIYGDEAYKKAGSFPGAFDIGENYNQYEEIFRKNMGEDILKVKDKKYVGDGTLTLTDEVKTPTPDDDVTFATGGRASFAGGKLVDEFILMITKKEPVEAMKEVNKVLGKKGKYKNLTQEDIDRIVNQTEDHIFQRDPDNLFVEDRPMFKKETDDVDLSQGMIDLDELNFTSNAKAAKEAIDNTSVNKEIKEGVAEIMSDTSPAALEKSIEVDNLRLKYPGMDKNLAEQIATEGNPRKKADIIAMVEQTFKMSEQGMSGDDIIQAFKNTPRTKQADGGITRLRNGYYGGGQAMVGEDLSQIGHGSDSLMARNMQLAPNSMATTSTGLNYLLGEDNDTVRVPYNEGKMVLPKPKPAQSPLVELSRIYKTYEEAMPGVSKDTQQYLQQDFIQKLNDAGISQEAFMTYKMQNNFANGGRIGYATKGKVDLADLEALKGLKKARGENEGGIGGLSPMGRQMNPSAARSQRNRILDKAIAKLTYAVDNLDQETREKVISAFNDQLQIGYETTMSGLKMDAADKIGIVPIDKETIYKAIINMDLPKETQLEVTALGNSAGEEELSFSLSNNKLGITYDNESQTIQGNYRFNSKDGKTSITPAITKDQDSQIQSSVKIRKAIKNGKIKLDVEKDTTDNSLTTDFTFDSKDGNTLTAENVSGTDNNYFKAEGTAEVPAYMLKDGSMPSISAEYYKDKGDNLSNYQISSELPIYTSGTSNLVADISNTINANNTSNTELGLRYNKFVKNPFVKNQSNSSGILSFDARMDDDNNKNLFAKLSFPFGNNTTDNIGNMNFDNEVLSIDEKERREREKLENTMFYNGNEYRKNNIYSGNELSGLIEGTKDNLKLSDFIGPVQELASGGIAGLRQGYAGGKGVDIARRGFLKILGGSVAAATAFKMGLVKMLGKESGAVSKKAVDQFFASGTSGAPTWFEPLVNKALREGLDITEKAAVKDGQIVKSLDTPTGKVDVTYDTRTGAVDIDYMGGDTAMGEGLQMRYAPGEIIEEGANMGKKTDDVFEAVETVPESKMYSPDDYQVEFGENMTSNIDDLYSDTSELKKLGGEKLLVKDISNTLKKKKVLKEMDNNPDQFASDNLPDYDY